MKMKIILSILFVLLLSGCNIEYNIEIKEDKTYNETLYIKNMKKTNMSYQDVRNAFYEKLPDYKISTPNYDSENIKATIENQSLSMIKHSEIVKYAYYSESKNKNEIILTPNTEMLDSIFYDIENEDKPTGAQINVKITLPFEVEYTNANDVKDNTYIWKIDKDNYKKIEIKFNSNQIKKTTKQKQNEKTFSIIIITFISISIISFIISTVIKYKNRNGGIK